MSSPARLLVPLLLAGVAATGARAFDPAMVPEPPPLPRYQARVIEGSLWGTPFSNIHALAGSTRGHLFLRLFPPARGRYAPLPSMEATREGNTILVWEVPPALHAPAVPPHGWADLGPTPPLGTYQVHVKLRRAEPVALTVELSREHLTMKAAGGLADAVAEDGGPPPALTPAVEVADRLPAGAFTYRYDHPHGHFNRAYVRRRFERAIEAETSVSRLGWPGRHLSDPVFRDFLEDGGPPLHTTDPAQVLENMKWMARQTDANIQVRWYGGAVWDLRDIRRGVYPDPHWLPNLDVTYHGAHRSDTFSPEDRHRRAHEPIKVVTLQPRYGLGGGAVPLPKRRRTSVFSPDMPAPHGIRHPGVAPALDAYGFERRRAVAEEDLEVDLDEDLGDLDL